MILNRHHLHTKLTAVYFTLLGFHQFLTCSLFPQAVLHSESNLSSSSFSFTGSPNFTFAYVGANEVVFCFAVANDKRLHTP